MYPFLAVLWTSAEFEARINVGSLCDRLSENTAKWHFVMRTPGFFMLTATPECGGFREYVLPNGAGVILGRLFRRSMESDRDDEFEMDERSATRIVRTSGRALVDEYWGSYIAVLDDREHGRRHVIRDCSGRLPCYFFRNEEVQVFFSDIQDLLTLRAGSLTLNYDYLAGFLYFNELQIHATGLREVTEILAGECASLTNGSVSQFPLWDPSRVCAENLIDDYQHAAHELRSTTQRCIAGWARTQKRILHSLSGGLDSAVVAGCFKESKVDASMLCINRYHDAPGEDERKYARIAARRLGVELLEYPFNDRGLLDHRVLALPKTAKPCVPFLFRMLDICLYNKLTRERKINTVWTGQGGDHLFFQYSELLPVSDYVCHHGLGLQLHSVISGAAQLTGESYWAALRSALRSIGRRPRWQYQTLQQPTYFLHEDAVPPRILEYIAHPWTRETRDLPPGKQMQIHFLAEVLNRHRPIPRLRLVEEHHPLMSQPIIELCLRIPTYLLVKGGRDRALARDAFRDIIPHEIYQRRDKGSTGQHAIELMRRSGKFLNEMLLDGVLVREGIVDRRSVESFSTNSTPIRPEHYFPLIACIACEVWLNTWNSRSGCLAV